MSPAEDRASAGGMPALVAFDVPADRVLVAHVHGDLDLLTVPPLREALDHRLRTSAPCRLVLDLREVTLLSSAGLALLVELHRRARTLGVHLVLVGAAHRAVHLPLRLTGLLALFDTRPAIDSPTPRVRTAAAPSVRPAHAARTAVHTTPTRSLEQQ